MACLKMVDAGWVREDCDSWYQARWPLPSPAVVRAAKGAVKDTEGRFYVKMSQKNASKLGLSLAPVWYWYALPPPRKRTETVGQPLVAEDRVWFGFGRRRVATVGWDIERKRSVGVISWH